MPESIGTCRRDGNRTEARSGSEIELLREEIDRYRTIFDSASLIAGHELIKPLTSISGYAELLEEKLGCSCDEDGRRYFSRIRESISALEELIESFIQLLRSDRADEQAGILEKVDLRELVEEIRMREGGAGVRLRNTVDPGMPPLLLRRKHMEVVLENLVSNALKHSGGDVPVTVGAEVMADRRGSSGDRVLIVRVSDEGVGIPEDELEEIFNPFYRGSSNGRAGGLGLGLPLVRNMIEIMGGNISVSSRSGEGTEVTFSIPLPGGSLNSWSRNR